MTTGIQRSQLEIFHDILSACNKYSQNHDLIGEKPLINITKVQLSCGMAYNIIKKKMHELESKKLITLKPSMGITSLGIKVLKQSEIILDSIDELANSIIPTNDENPHNFDDKSNACLPVSHAHKERDSKQVINVQNAIIMELES